MENRIYKSKRAFKVAERHASGEIIHEIWNYIFCYKDNEIYIVKTGGTPLKLYFNRNLLLDKPYFREKEHSIEFQVNNSVMYLMEFSENYIEAEISILNSDNNDTITGSYKLVEYNYDDIGRVYGQISVNAHLLDSPLGKEVQPVFKGDEVEILKKEETWYFIKVNQKNTGWLPKDAVRMWKL